MRSSKSLSWSGLHHILTLPIIPRIPGAHPRCQDATRTPRDSRTPVELVAEADHGAGVDPPLVPNPPGRPGGTRAGGVEGCLPADGEDIPTIWRLLSDHHHGFDVNPSAIEG